MFLWPGPSAPAIKTPPPSPSYREGCAGGGGVWRPRGRRPLGLPNKKRGPEAKPPAPRFSGRFASSRRSSQRSLCVAARAASFNSLAHWASASLHPPLAALGSAPPPPGFPPTPKRQRKSPAFRSIQPRSAPTRKKVVATASRSEGVYNRAGERERAFFRRGAATE